MKRLLTIFLLLAWMLLSTTPGAAAQGARSFVWERIDADVQVQADGLARVTETLTLRYTGGPFTFAFRDLPDRRLDGISNVSVRDNERAYQQVDDEESTQPYTFSIYEEDDAQRVRWVYPPTTDTSRTFTLTYDVTGAIRRYRNNDELWWSMVFADREEVVEQASGRIVLPTAVPGDQLNATAPDVPGVIERTNGQVSVQAGNIQPEQELTLRVQFPKNVVGGEAPGWQRSAETQEQYNATTRPTVNAVLSAVSAGFLALFSLLLAGWWRKNRDPRPSSVGITGYSLQPPDDLPPALATKLVHGQDGDALLATLFDLANRGYVTLHETRPGSTWRAAQITARRMEKPAYELTPIEQRVLDIVFKDAPEVQLDKRASEISQNLDQFGKLAQNDLLAQGYVTEAGLRNRRTGIGIGAVLLVLGAVLLIPGFIFAERYSWWLPVIPALITAFGLVWMIVASAVYGTTERGAEARQRWIAFQQGLKRIKPDLAPGGQFSALLPYAVAIGSAKQLTKAYSVGREPLPAWYYPVIIGNGSDGGGSATATSGLMLHDFSQNFLTSLQSLGGSTGAAGSGGASGGGASGGGGGGAG